MFSQLFDGAALRVGLIENHRPIQRSSRENPHSHERYLAEEVYLKTLEWGKC